MFPVGPTGVNRANNLSTAQKTSYGFGSSGTKRAIASALSDKQPAAENSLCKVRLEITVHDLPNMPQGSKRSFLDFLYLDDQYDVIYLQDAVRNKLKSIDCENVDFEILTNNGFVVDDSYFSDMLSKALTRWKSGPSTQSHAGSGGLATLGGTSTNATSSASAPKEPETWQFDIFIKKKKLTLESLAMASGGGLDSMMLARPNQQKAMGGGGGGANLACNRPPASAPAALQASLHVHLSDRSAVQLVPIAALTSTLARGQWRMECRVKTVKKKSDNIAECEVADLYAQHQIISLVTFKRECIDRLLNLKPNACVQLWNVVCQPKNSRDLQFSTNSHPMKLVYDEGSEVQLIDDPIIVGHGEGGSVQAIGIKSSRPYPTAATGLGGLPPPPVQQQPTPPLAGTFSSTLLGANLNRPQPDAETASTVGTQSLAGTVRTGVTSLATTTVSTVSGASYGVPPIVVKRTYLNFGPAKTTAATATAPPAVASSSAAPFQQDVVHARDDYLNLKTAQEELDAERLKKKLRSEVTDKCFICDLDLNDDADIAVLISRIDKFRCKKVPIPTPETIKELMSDRRTLLPDFEEGRVYCKTTFVNTVTKKLHRVHCRCAHLTTDYQKGDDLQTVVAMAFMNTCALCGEPGACMACTNPECEDMYHTTCAIFSNGFINFDIRDPYLPRPACPRHTNPNPRGSKDTARSIRLSWLPNSGMEAFDSACVDRYDLRDPDDE